MGTYYWIEVFNGPGEIVFAETAEIAKTVFASRKGIERFTPSRTPSGMPGAPIDRLTATTFGDTGEYRAGSWAYRNGYGIDRNPWVGRPHGDELARSWRLGWLNASERDTDFR